MFVVAGVTGHVGSVVAAELLSGGEKVRVIVRDETKGEPFAARGAEVAVGTLEDASFLTKALEGARGAFLLLPPNLAVADFRAYQRKVAGTMAQAVKAASVPHVVLLSSVGADLEAGTGPIVGLHDFERQLLETGCTLTALRAGYFMENVAGMIGAAKAQGIYPSFAPADASMPMIATVDLGVQAARALLSPPQSSETIDIHGPAYDANQIAEILGKKLGKTLTVVAIPQAGWTDALCQAGLPKPMAELYAEMYGAFLTGAVKPCGDRAVQGSTRLEQVVEGLDA